MSKASSVVACVTQQSRQSSTVSDRVQKTSEGHMSCDGTTAWRADDQRRSVDDVSVPSRRPKHNQQLDTETRYRWGSDESTWCSGTSSQWRLSCISCVKPRSNFLVPSQNAGYAFITRCSLLVMTFGAPARTTLQ